MPKKPATEQPASNEEILDAIRIFSSELEERFIEIKEENKQMRLDMTLGFTAVRKHMEKEIGRLEWKMVTKDYLDEKLYDLKGDLITLAKKQDRKSTAIVHWLKEKAVLNNAEADAIIKLTPFPQHE